MPGTNDDTNHYEGAVLEDINHKLAAILEGQAAMAGVPAAIQLLQTDVVGLKQDVNTVRQPLAT